MYFNCTRPIFRLIIPAGRNQSLKVGRTAFGVGGDVQTGVVDSDLVDHLELIQTCPGTCLSDQLPEDDPKAEYITLG